MSTQNDNAALVRAVYEAFNEHDLRPAGVLAVEDVELVEVPTARTLRGPEGFKEGMRAWIRACSDAIVEVVEMFAGEGDTVTTEFVGRGTHDGPMASPRGEIPPTGRSLELRFCELYRMRDGKIASARLYYDAATLLGQLGLMPQPEGAVRGPRADTRALAGLSTAQRVRLVEPEQS